MRTHVWVAGHISIVRAASEMVTAFSWCGLPRYAARLLAAAMTEMEQQCPVIATHPVVPVPGMEEALGEPVHWVASGRRAIWNEFDIDPPSVFCQSGWAEPAFSSLAREVRHAGGRVILMMDNNWVGDFRQRVVGAAAFRTLYQNHYDGALVPGRAASRLAAYYGFPPSRIREGMYGADPSRLEPSFGVWMRDVHEASVVASTILQTRPPRLRSYTNTVAKHLGVARRRMRHPFRRVVSL